MNSLRISLIVRIPRITTMKKISGSRVLERTKIRIIQNAIITVSCCPVIAFGTLFSLTSKSIMIRKPMRVVLALTLRLRVVGLYRRMIPMMIRSNPINLFWKSKDALNNFLLKYPFTRRIPPFG